MVLCTVAQTICTAVQCAMQKEIAIQLLGGSIKSASEAIGITYWAVYKWPDTLPKRISDRVEAALSRMKDAPKRKKVNVEFHTYPQSENPA